MLIRDLFEGCYLLAFIEGRIEQVTVTTVNKGEYAGSKPIIAKDAKNKYRFFALEELSPIPLSQGIILGITSGEVIKPGFVLLKNGEVIKEGNNLVGNGWIYKERFIKFVHELQRLKL